MKVIFDTNILVLYVLGDPAFSIMEAAFTGFPVESLSFFYSEAMLNEYRDVLEELTIENPTTFRPERVVNLLAQVQEQGHLIYPAIILSVGDPDACTHEPDNRFLECALEANAAYLVTVNDEHFPAHRQDIKIVGPTQFRNILFA